MDNHDVLRAVVSSDANLPLAAERLSKKFSTKTLEYDIIELITTDDTIATDIAKGLRSLLVVRLFDQLMQLQNALLSSVDSLDPKDVARTYTSMLSVFNTLTTPATKVAFDFTSELRKIAEELELDVTEVEREVKSLSSK